VSTGKESPTFRSIVAASSSGVPKLNMKAPRSSEKSGNIYWSTLRNIPDDLNLEPNH